MGNLMELICIGCNENEISITELYCLNCYLDKNSENMAELEALDQLWLTKEAN